VIAIKRLVLPCILALALGAPAWADTMEVLYRHTLKLTDASGGVTTMLFSDARKMEQTDPSGMWAAGFWSHDAGRGLCVTARGKSEICFPLAADKTVGEQLGDQGPDGRDRLDGDNCQGAC
jgi:hypothetical protein